MMDNQSIVKKSRQDRLKENLLNKYHKIMFPREIKKSEFFSAQHVKIYSCVPTTSEYVEDISAGNSFEAMLLKISYRVPMGESREFLPKKINYWKQISTDSIFFIRGWW